MPKVRHWSIYNPEWIRQYHQHRDLRLAHGAPEPNGRVVSGATKASTSLNIESGCSLSSGTTTEAHSSDIPWENKQSTLADQIHQTQTNNSFDLRCVPRSSIGDADDKHGFTRDAQFDVTTKDFATPVAGNNGQPSDVDSLESGVDWDRVQPTHVSGSTQDTSSNARTSQFTGSDIPVAIDTTAATTAPSNSEELRLPLTPTEDQHAVDQNHTTRVAVEQVVLDLDDGAKEFIYSFKNVYGLFLGVQTKVRPPPTRWKQWKDEVEGRLWIDVQGFQNRFKRVKNGCVQVPGVAIDCRMSGHVSADGKQVILSPTIWILYDHKRWEKKIHKFVEELEWLPGEGFGKPEVHKGCPRFANLDISVESLRLEWQEGFSLPGDVELFIHVEEPTSTTACGLLCCATFMKNGLVKSQYVSRIGGMMNLDETTSAITTAHGFMEDVLQQMKSHSGSWESHSQDDCSEQMSKSADSDIAWSDSDSTTSDEEDEIDDDDGVGQTCTPAGKLIGALDPETLAAISWVQLPPSSVRETCFLGTSGRTIEDCIQESNSLDIRSKEARICWKNILTTFPRGPTAGDFSFLSLPYLHKLCNYYDRKDQRIDPKKGAITRFAKPEELTGGQVSLLLRPDNSARGTLLPAGNEIFFSLYGALIRASKIVMDAPLARGCSGTWVVRDGLLCGVIVATYEDEPLALMVSAQDLIQEIKETFPHISTVTIPIAAGNSPNGEFDRSAMSSRDTMTLNRTGKRPASSRLRTLISYVSLTHQDTALSRTFTNGRVSSFTDRVTDLVSARGSAQFICEPTPSARFANDYASEQQHNTPPVSETHMLSILEYKEDQTVLPILTINAVVDKGFFLVDDEWTCYKRNYFSCTCSYFTSPSIDASALQLIDPVSGVRLGVHGLAIGISAVVRGNESCAIELVQHSSNRDKAPTPPPDVSLASKSALDQDVYIGGYQEAHKSVHRRPLQISPPQSLPAEHTFERLQFLRATADNGRKRTEQQYFRLVFKIYAEINTDGGERLIPIAQAKSAPLIVRGRPAGHYKAARETSTSSTASAVLDMKMRLCVDRPAAITTLSTPRDFKYPHQAENEVRRQEVMRMAA